MAVSNNSINTEIGIGIKDSSLMSVKELKDELQRLKFATNASEKAFKAQGDELNASKSAYDGATAKINAQKESIERLKEKQNEITGTTAKDIDQRAKLAKQIAQQESKLVSLTSEQEKAKKAYDYEASGIGDLTRKRKADEEAVRAEVAALKAEGKEQEANKVKREGTKRSIESLNKTLDAQRGELERLKKSGATQDQIRQQELYVNGTRKNLAEARGEYRKLSTDSKKSFDSMEDSAKKSTTSIKDIIKGSAIGSLVASGARKALSTIASSVDDAVKRVDTLNNSTKAYENMGIKAGVAKKANEELLKAIDGLPTSLDEATKSQQLLTSSMDNDVGQATKVFKAMNDGILGFGGSADQVNEAVTQLSQAFSNGKIDGQTWNSMINAQMGPTLNALAKKMNMTTGEMKEGLSSGKISVKEFQDALIEMDVKGGGGLKSLNKIAKDSTDGVGTSMQNLRTKIVSSVANVIQGLQKAGLSKHINAVSKALGDSSKTFENWGIVAGQALKSVVSFVPFFVEIIKPLATIAGIMAGAAFKMFKGIIEGIAAPFGALAKSTGETSKNLNPIAATFEFIAKQKTMLETVAKIMASIFVVNKINTFSKSLFEMSSNVARDTKKRLMDLGLIRKELNGVQADALKANASLNAVQGGSAVPKTRMEKNHGKASVGVSGVAAENAGKIAGNKWAKGFKFAGSAGVGIAMAALPELMSKDKNVEKAGSATGAVIGGALGATMGPMGAMIGAQVGAPLGKEMTKAINKTVDLEALALRLKQPFSKFFDWFETQGKASATKATKEMSKKFDGFLKGRKTEVLKVKVDTTSIDKASNDSKKKFEGMRKDVDDYYKKQQASNKKVLDDQLKNGEISKKDYDARLKKTNANLDKEKKAKLSSLREQEKAEQKYYKKVSDVASGNTKNLLAIEQKYGKNSKQYKEEQAKEKKKIDNEYRATTEKNEKKANKEKLSAEDKSFKRLTDLQKDYGKRKKKLSWSERVNAANEADKERIAITKAADATYKKSVSSAEKKYKDSVKNAKYQRDELGTISESEYQKIVKNAGKTKDKSVKEANEKRKKTTAEAEKQRDNTVKAASEAGKKTVQATKDQKSGELREQEKGNKKLKQELSDFGKQVNKIWRDTWKNVSKFFKDTWDDLKEITSKGTKWVQNKISDFGENVSKGWRNTWKGVRNFFSDIWDDIKKRAGDGFNSVIGIVNKGIDGINGVIHSFGGNKTTIDLIPKVRFATGTNNWRDVMGTVGAGAPPGLAMVNDGNGAEAIVYPDGRTVVPSGRDVVMPMMGGETVIPHEQAAKVGLVKPNAYKNGVGNIMGAIGKTVNSGVAWAGKAFSGGKSFVSDILDDIKEMVKDFTGGLKSAWTFVQDPKKAFSNAVAPIAGGASSFAESTVKMGRKQVDNFGGAWMGEVANAVKDVFGGGGSGSGGSGDDYPSKLKVPGAMDIMQADPWGYYVRQCVSFVASRLKNVGNSTSLFSGLGNGSQWGSAKVPHHSTPKPGDVSVYGAGSRFGNHVAIVTDVKNGKYKEEGYNFNRNGKYYGPNKFGWMSNSGATTFLRFPKSGIKGAKSSAEDKPKNGLRGLVDKQIKKAIDNLTSMFDNVTSKYTDESDSQAVSSKATGGHKNWLKQAGINDNFDKWNYIISHESGWNPRAKNPGSDAYGIGQALPPSKMARFGSDYMTNPITQLKWMKSYVGERYGGIDGAYDWWKSHHWYENGGLVSHPEVLVAGEKAPEFIIPTEKAKKMRANDLLQQAYKTVNGKEIGENQSSFSDEDVNQLVTSVDTLVKLMGAVLGVNQEQLRTMQTNKNSGNMDLNNALAMANSISGFQDM